MTFRIIFKSIAAVSSLALFGASLIAQEKPNFIVFNIDDLGYAEVGAFGSNNSTPNIDRLATEGRKLTSHYAAPICSPSRAALMTGSYPKRALPIPHVLFPGGAVGLNPEERTVAEVLKEVGYSTACIGKWHLGDQPEFLPTQQGFDYFFGLPYSNDMGPAAEGTKSDYGAPLPKPGQGKGPNPSEYGERGSDQAPLPLFRGRDVIARVRAEEQQKLTAQYTDEAVAYIKARRGSPFFLYLPHTAVHVPFYPSAPYRGKSPNGLRGDWVQELDASIGRVMDAVRAAGIENNTLVIFTSDNGGPLIRGGVNTPLRGGKAQTFEGGVRVCTIAWWPGVIPAGTSTDDMTSMMDILPTFAKFAGAAVPADRMIDGVDISSTLLGKSNKPARSEFFYFSGFELQAVRSGPWKYFLASKELYNLAEDIGESKNLADSQPDVIANLLALAKTMDNDLGQTGLGPGCRPLGRVKNALPAIGMDGVVRSEFSTLHKKFP